MGDLPLRTPTHRRLGEPLPRQLSNGTHAHFLPPKLSRLYHAILTVYGVLIFISKGYPPVRTRLHTCYAPVRRSPSKYCYFMLPLDLHVLGLSLAFILSQDQTLHCNIMFCFVLFLCSNVILFRIDLLFSFLVALYPICHRDYSRFALFQWHSLWKASAK